LPEPFSIQIQERKKHEKRPRTYRPYVIAELEAGVRKDKDYDPGPYGLKDPQSAGFGYLETLLEQIKYPDIFVRKRIDRKQVLVLSRGGGDALVDEVIRTMKAFHPLVEFINR
jgi:hypothetical protein